MKRILYKTLTILIVCSLTTALFACNSSIDYGDEYSMYTYNTSAQEFSKTTASYTINDDYTFVFKYGQNASELYGTYKSDSDASTYKLTYDVATGSAMFEAMKAELTNSGEFTNADIESIISQMTLTESLYYYKDYMFTNASIEAYKYIDSEEDAIYGLDAIEGVYMVNDMSVQMKLEAGNIYIQDTTTPVSGEFPTKRGYYVVERNFLVMHIVNQSTNVEVATAKYLMGVISMPTELIDTSDDELDADDLLAEVSDEEAWVNEINTYLAELEGKQVMCLTSSFYYNKDLK